MECMTRKHPLPSKLAGASFTVVDAHSAGHRAMLAESERETLNGVPVTSPARTFLDIAATSGVTLDEVIILGDALVNEHRRYAHARTAVISLGELRAYVDSAAGRRGAARAREALAWVRVGADSPMETRLRLAVQRAGLPDVLPDYPVIDELGQPVFVDLAFEKYRIAVQYDGGHHLTPEQRRLDALRAQRLADAGWRQVIITKLDMRQGNAFVVGRIAEALRRQGWEDPRG